MRRVFGLAFLAATALLAWWWWPHTSPALVGEPASSRGPAAPRAERVRASSTVPVLLWLVDEEGAPVAGVPVQAGHEVRTSDAAGLAAFELEPGEAAVVVDAVGWVRAAGTVKVTPPLVERRLMLSRRCDGPVRLVYDDGEPLAAGQAVWVAGVALSTDDRGRVLPPWRMCGRLDLVVQGPPQVPVSTVVHGPGEVVARVPSDRVVELRTVDERGHPVDAWPWVLGDDDDEPTCPATFTDVARPEVGVLVFTGPARFDTVALVARGYQEREVTLPAAGGTWRVTLLPARALRVQVLGDVAERPTGLWCQHTLCEPEPDASPPVQWLCPCPPGEVRLHDLARDFARVPGDVAQWVLDLRGGPAAVAGRWSGDPTAVLVEVVAQDRHVRPAPDGTFLLAELPAGTQVVRVRDARSVLWSRRLELRPGETLDLGQIGVDDGAFYGRLLTSVPLQGAVLQVDGNPTELEPDGSFTWTPAPSEGLAQVTLLTDVHGWYQAWARLERPFTWVLDPLAESGLEAVDAAGDTGQP